MFQGPPRPPWFYPPCARQLVPVCFHWEDDPYYAVELGSNVGGSLRPRRPGRGVWTRSCHGVPPLFGKQLSSWPQSPHLTVLRIRLLSSALVSFFSQVSFPGGITVSSANTISGCSRCQEAVGTLGAEEELDESLFL